MSHFCHFVTHALRWDAVHSPTPTDTNRLRISQSYELIHKHTNRSHQLLFHHKIVHKYASTSTSTNTYPHKSAMVKPSHSLPYGKWRFLSSISYLIEIRTHQSLENIPIDCASYVIASTLAPCFDQMFYINGRLYIFHVHILLLSAIRAATKTTTTNNFVATM